MTLSLFGAPAIEHGGMSHVLDFERRTQLLAYLALKRAWVGRAEIAALLWPEQEARLALANLRKALHRLQSLPGAGSIETQGSALRFPVATDVQGFEQALAERRLPDDSGYANQLDPRQAASPAVSDGDHLRARGPDCGPVRGRGTGPGAAHHRTLQRAQAGNA